MNTLSAFLAKFDSNTFHNYLALIAIYVGLQGMGFTLPTLLVAVMAGGIAFKEGLGKIADAIKPK